MTRRSPPATALRRRRQAALLACAALLAVAAASCRTAGVLSRVERGVASWYGPKFHGRLTANGERYDMHALTAAHRTLPFGTVVEVVNVGNGRRVAVRINDRGPFAHGRIIDLSYAAAREIGLVGPGTARVEVRPVVPRVAPEDQPFSHVRFTLQVAAFRDAARAAALQAELAALFPEAVVRAEGGWHRVQVGSYDWRRKAEAARRELARRGYAALVVPLVADTL
jgi:rare lipoprotein A